MEEKELIEGNWYKIKTTNKASNPGDEYCFQCAENKKGMSLHHFSSKAQLYGNGDLTQSNFCFKGNDYVLCDQVEVLWCENCVRQGKYIPFNKNDYQTEPQFDLIF